MANKIRIFITGSVLIAYVLGSTGCAVGWFLLGAGAAATAVTVMSDKDKEKEESLEVEED